MNFRIVEINLNAKSVELTYKIKNIRYYKTLNIRNEYNKLNVINNELIYSLLINKVNNEINTLIKEYAPNFNNKNEILNYIIEHMLEINSTITTNKNNILLFNWLYQNNIHIENITIENVSKENIFLELTENHNNIKCLYNGCLNNRIFETIRSNNVDDCYRKFCSSDCLSKFRSSVMCGDKNAFHRTPKETLDRINKQQSIIMKEKIKNGIFTPPITNTWTHYESKILLNGDIKHLRSSWEAFFYLLNEKLEFEKLRIPYKFNNKDHIYIVDFIDTINKIIYEIKPDSMRKIPKNISKMEYARKWCVENNYTYLSIGNDWFLTNYDEIKNKLSNQPNNESLLIKLNKIKK